MLLDILIFAAFNFMQMNFVGIVLQCLIEQALVMML